MNPYRRKKIIVIISILCLVSAALGLILYALKQNINLFYTPTQLLHAEVSASQTLRMGGYVKNHSVRFDDSGQTVFFTVTDRRHSMAVQYHGVLPSLFREGQTVVVTGKLNPQHELIADQVLAKHDEKYMPRSLAKELEKS